MGLAVRLGLAEDVQPPNTMSKPIAGAEMTVPRIAAQSVNGYGRRKLPKFLDRCLLSLWVGVDEAARDQYGGAVRDRLPAGFRVDAAVDLDVELGIEAIP